MCYFVVRRYFWKENIKLSHLLFTARFKTYRSVLYYLSVGNTNTEPILAILASRSRNEALKIKINRTLNLCCKRDYYFKQTCRLNKKISIYRYNYSLVGSSRKFNLLKVYDQSLFDSKDTWRLIISDRY